MKGRAKIRAASSAVASLALATMAVFAVGPVISANATDDPPMVEPCGPGEQCDVVTVTVTVTPGESPLPTPTVDPDDPVVTVRITVTPTPTAPVVTKTVSQQQQQRTESPEPLPIPTREQTVPTYDSVTEPPEPTVEPEVTLPPAATTQEETQTATPVVQTQPTPTATASFDEPAPETVPIEIRNATPEFDKSTVANKLAIVAAVMVALALSAWLMFEKRFRRIAHAAAAQKAGAKAGAAGKSQAVPGHPASTGYAPLVGFVPVQTYTVAYPQQPYGYPVPYATPQAYGQAVYGAQGYPSPYYPQGQAAAPQGQAAPEGAPQDQSTPRPPEAGAGSDTASTST